MGISGRGPTRGRLFEIFDRAVEARREANRAVSGDDPGCLLFTVTHRYRFGARSEALAPSPAVRVVDCEGRGELLYFMWELNRHSIPWPEHLIPFLQHLKHSGSVLSQRTRRVRHSRQPCPESKFTCRAVVKRIKKELITYRCFSLPAT